MTKNENIDNNKIKSLEERISALKDKKVLKKDLNSSNGERVISELVAGLIVGTLLGIGLDKFFNTKPILTVIFILLGLAGSIYNLYKASLKIDSEVEVSENEK